jgi:TetR/AcrR family transcriptional regulator, transcriptional repressor for nem operon
MGRTKEFVVEEALERARDIFWSHGFEGASLSDLTEGMGIQRASLYGTFGSKAELFQQALAQYQDLGYRTAERLLAEGTDPKDSLRRFLESAIPEHSETERRGCFCVNVAVELAPHDPVVARQLETHFARVRALLAKTIAAGQAQGQLSLDVAPLEAAAYLLTCLNGLHVSAKTATDLPALRRRAALMLGALTA